MHNMEICVLFSQGEKGRERGAEGTKITTNYLSGLVNGLIKIAAMILLDKYVLIYIRYMKEDFFCQRIKGEEKFLNINNKKLVNFSRFGKFLRGINKKSTCNTISILSEFKFF